MKVLPLVKLLVLSSCCFSFTFAFRDIPSLTSNRLLYSSKYRQMISSNPSGFITPRTPKASRAKSVRSDEEAVLLKETNNPTNFAAIDSVKSSTSTNTLWWRALVLFICVMWSTNFAVIKMIQEDGLVDLDPSLYSAIRFSIAALVLFPKMIGSFRNFSLIKESLMVSTLKFIAYYGQALGMLTSTANKSAFICSMNVVWVALLSGLLYNKFRLQTWVAIFFAMVGIGVLELEGSTVPVIGDAWLLLQPIGFGTSYVFLERLMNANYNAKDSNSAIDAGSEKDTKPHSVDAGALSAFSLLGIAILSIIWAVSEGHTLDDVLPIFESKKVTAGLLYTGLFTTAGGVWLQSIAFKRVTATDVSLILTAEPIFATVFAALLLGETISGNDITGGLFICAACLINELNLVDKFTSAFGKGSSERV